MAVSRRMTCRQCGAQLSAVRPGGLCPLCQQSNAEGDAANVALGNRSSVAPARRKPTLASAIASLSAKLFGGPRFGNSRKQPPADALCNLGLALARQGKVDEAIARFRAAIRIKPNHGAAHNNLGLALEAQGKFDEAITEYRAAIRLQTTPNRITTSASSWIARGSGMQQSPNIVRRSDSSPILPMSTSNLAWPWVVRGSWMKRSPPSARQSATIPIGQWPTTTSDSPCIN